MGEVQGHHVDELQGGKVKSLTETMAEKKREWSATMAE